MSKKGIVRNISLMLAAVLGTVNLGGCGEEASSDRAEVEMVCYKPEAVKAFEKIEARFNETHDDIHLTISSPNEAMTILKQDLSEKIIQISLELEETATILTFWMQIYFWIFQS